MLASLVVLAATAAVHGIVLAFTGSAFTLPAPIVGLLVTLLIVRIAWDAWRTVRAQPDRVRSCGDV